ncbi:hypothetical protein EIP91_008781 [Steccherinum ochraceum]|uniref:Uncharacterized protein n=1 Tax=Steccherinum ochraceum TaxID=92696 RepID=A0A4R0R2D7_9APHY|nr:hypothetical protein EIP91_008781 [Steccherinum ochraceum]
MPDLTVSRMAYVGNVLGNLGIGMYFVLASIAIRFLLKHRNETRPQKVVLGYTITMLATATIWFVCAARVNEIQTAVEKGLSEDLDGVEQSNLKKIINVAFVLNIWLADSLFICRLYIIWNRFLLIVIMPLLLWLGSVGVGITLSVSLATGYSLLSEFTAELQSALFCLSVSVNVIVTICIAIRRKVMSNYTVLAIIVESAALYAVFGVVFIPVVAKQMDLQFAMYPVIGSLAVISPTLIVLRIALGTAATATTVSLPTFVRPNGVDMSFQPPSTYDHPTTTSFSTTSAQLDVVSEPSNDRDGDGSRLPISENNTANTSIDKV